MHSPIARFAFAVVLGAYTSTAPAQLLSHHDLSYSIARTIAETAIDSCTAKGYRVSAVVVDRAGDIIVALRGDNASPHTMENARRKAYTALSFRISTTAYAKRLADGDPVVREQRRLQQQNLRGTAAEATVAELRERDRRDRTRAASPLTPAKDAAILDSTGLSEDEVLRRVEELVQQKL